MSEAASKTAVRRRTATSTPAATDQGAGEAQHDLEDLIQQRAYHIWESQGRPAGRSEEHWMLAEREVRGSQAAAALDPAVKRRAPQRDTTGAVAKPVEASQPGASAKLGGTPAANAVSGGRGTGTGARRRTTTRTS